MMLEVDDIHDDMTFKVIRGQGQGQEMTSVPYRDYFLFIITFSLFKKFFYIATVCVFLNVVRITFRC